MRKLLVLFSFALCIIGISSLALAYIYTEGSGKLEIFFLNVGQGDAILIHTPDNLWALIDTGRSGVTLMQELSEVWHYWDRPLSFVLATHADADHIGGLSGILSHYSVERVFMNKVSKENATLLKIKDLLSGKIQNSSADLDDDFTLGCCINIDFVWPPSENYYFENDEVNDQSISFLLSYKSFEVFLGGDLGHEFEEVAAQTVQVPADGIDVLKLGHHGSKTSTSELVLKELKPKLAIASVGAKNSYGHPAAEVLARLESFAIPLLRTDQQGRIKLSTDGDQLFVETEQRLEAFELKL